MKRKKILVCDDNQQIARRWSAQIGEVCPNDFVSESLPLAELVDVISDLEARRKDARASTPKTGSLHGFLRSTLAGAFRKSFSCSSNSAMQANNVSYGAPTACAAALSR